MDSCNQKSCETTQIISMSYSRVVYRKERVMMFPDEEDMIVKNRIPHKAIRAKKDYYAVNGDPVVTESNTGRDTMGEGQSKDGTGEGLGGGGIYDPVVIPDYIYPDWNSLSCSDLQAEIDKHNEWYNTNLSTGMMSREQGLTALSQMNTANGINQQKCLNQALAVCDKVLTSANVTGTPSNIKIDVGLPGAGDADGATGFAYEISKTGGGYSKTGNVTGNTTTITETIPAGTYTAQLRAMCGPATSTQVTTQEFTVTAPVSEAPVKEVGVIPVIPIANAALPKSTGGGGGGGAAPAAKKSTATAVKAKPKYWLWLLLIAAAGGTYYLYKKNKKK
jgi:hypothetical protein